MQHPFIGDLSDLSLDDLQTKVNEITKNMMFAQRMGNSSLVWQMQMALDSYKQEVSKRMDDMFKKQNARNPFMKKKDDEV
jgi:hypothetical protein